MRDRPVSAVSGLRREVVPALAAAPLEDGSARPRAHADPETMGLLPATDIRLVRAFHGESRQEAYVGAGRLRRGGGNVKGTGGPRSSASGEAAKTNPASRKIALRLAGPPPAVRATRRPRRIVTQQAEGKPVATASLRASRILALLCGAAPHPYTRSLPEGSGGTSHPRDRRRAGPEGHADGCDGPFSPQVWTDLWRSPERHT